MKTLRNFILLILVLVGGGAAIYFSWPEGITDSETIEIATKALSGGTQTRTNMPIKIEDQGASYPVYFLHSVKDEEGRYHGFQNYAFVDKKTGEVLKLGTEEIK